MASEQAEPHNGSRRLGSRLRKLNEAHWARVALMAMPEDRGHTQEMLVIRAKDVPMWLLTIHAGNSLF
jgi:hypothetical protein